MKQEWDSLVITAANLSTVSNELVSIIERVEHVLQQLNMGVSAWVQLDRHQSFGYTKVGKNWCLAIIVGAENETDWEETPLLQMSRNIKVQAIAKLPRLLRELNRQALTCANEITDKLVATSPIVEVMEQGKK